MKRGDVVLAFYPFSSGIGGSRRPALVVQSDFYNDKLANVVIAQITTTAKNAHDRANIPISIGTPLGRQSGLLHDSVVSCINLATIHGGRIDRIIGCLSPDLMKSVDAGLRIALSL
ncbi:MAG: transcriptional modulator of MazE/toxin MazF [Candidatus Peregrinibacteria bacterium Greene0416_19]|nr:MAG: transcriptional modulator of MazE/toxin MazF [Candidatus Peregrinibacteria bacterium Greene0416_19]